MFKLLQAPLSIQLLDLRSTVTKEVIILIVDLAKTYPAEFAHNSTKYLFNLEPGQSAFYKLLNNGKKLMSDMAHEGIAEILSTVCLPRYVVVA
jgi:hypothetical protein